MTSLGLRPGDVALADSAADAWGAAFRAEHERLTVLLDGLALGIEHVGSTAVPGLRAKPIIDIAIAIPDALAVERVSEVLLGSGYGFAIDAGDNGGLIFFKESPNGARTHHLHVIRRTDAQWTNYLKFRERLRSEPALRDAYAGLKARLAEEFAHDRDAYTRAKAEFIDGVVTGKGGGAGG